MSPPTPVGGQAFRWTMAHRFGSLSGPVNRYLASGYNGASGMTIQSSGQGIIDIAIWSQDTSGLDPGNRAQWLNRLGSGVESRVMDGYVKISP